VSTAVFEEIQKLVDSGDISRADGESLPSGVMRDIGIQSISMDGTTRLVM